MSNGLPILQYGTAMKCAVVALSLLLAAHIASGAITFFGASNCPADTAANGVSPYSCAPPSSMVAGDLVLAFPTDRNNGDAITNTTDGGQTWTVLGTADENNGGGMTTETYCAVFNGTWSGDPAWSFFWAGQFAEAISVDLLVYRPTAGFALDCTPDVALAYALVNAATAMSIAGQTPTASASVVTVAAWRWYSNATASALTAGWTTRGSDDDIYNSGAGDEVRSFADKIQSSASATGTVAQTASTTIDGITSIVTFKETASPTNKVVSGKHGRVGGPEVIR